LSAAFLFSWSSSSLLRAVVAAAAATTSSHIGGWFKASRQFADSSHSLHPSDLASSFPQGCGEKCPYVPGLQILDWPLTDPKGKPIEEVSRWRGGARGDLIGQADQEVRRWTRSKARTQGQAG
jgi:hypothetical protein